MHKKIEGIKSVPNVKFEKAHIPFSMTGDQINQRSPFNEKNEQNEEEKNSHFKLQFLLQIVQIFFFHFFLYFSHHFFPKI
jgi:hypothetical protein